MTDESQPNEAEYRMLAMQRVPITLSAPGHLPDRAGVAFSTSLLEWHRVCNTVDSSRDSNVARVLDLAASKGVLRAGDLADLDIPRIYLTRLTARGLLVKTGRGLYVLPDAEFSEHHSLAEASRRVPAGTVCLLSALSFHGIGTQLPHQVWLALDKGVWRPKVDMPRLRIIQMSGASLTSGVEHYNIEGVAVRVFGPAKTVADCFRFRNKIGVDTAVEALKDYLRDRRGTVDELMQFARADRVDNVLRPYLEALS
jgi:predicted transcriptional regulator of viral defense system